MKSVPSLFLHNRRITLLAIIPFLFSSCEFITDFDPPEIEIVAPSAGNQVPEGTITIVINVTDKNFSHAEIAGDGALLCRVESAENSTCQWQVLYNPNSSNQHTIKVKAFDKGGNRSEKTSQFYVSASPLMISGFVSYGNLNAIRDVTMVGLPGNPSTDENGYYEAEVNYGWSGRVTPSKIGSTFMPASRQYSNVISNQTNQNYTGILNTYSISGNIRDASGSLITGVIMNGLPNIPITDSGGYSDNVPHGWSGTVTPTKSGYTFNPASRLYSNVTSDFKNQDYVAVPTPCIYFTSNRDGNQEIYRMDVDGANVRRITNTSWSEQVPRVSPDGTKILFSSNQSGPVFRHYIMNVDGSDVRALPTYDYEDSPTSHAWYPDGQQVVFSTQIAYSPQSWSPSNVRLFTLNWNDLANSPMQILFGYDGNPSESIEVFWADWSANGRYLAYHHGHTPSNDSDVDIYIFDFLDESRDPVTTDRFQNTRPAWSPDGTKIVFTDGSSICVINPDGINEVCLTDGNWPRWSPDGSKIVFNSDRDGRWHIYVMNADGTGIVQLTQGNHDNLNPDWSKR